MKIEALKGKDCIKNFIKLEMLIKASLASLLTIPRNEAINKAFKKEYFVLNEQSEVTWENYMHNIPAYEKALQAFIMAEDNYMSNPEYLHNNMDKLLTVASDIRDLYDNTINYLKQKSKEPEFRNILVMTKTVVNNLLDAVISIVEVEERFKNNLDRKEINYIEKYKLHSVE